MGAGASSGHRPRAGNATHHLVSYQLIVILRFMRRTSGREVSSATIITGVQYSTLCPPAVNSGRDHINRTKEIGSGSEPSERKFKARR